MFGLILKEIRQVNIQVMMSVLLYQPFGTGVVFTIGIWYRSETFVNWQTWVSTTRGGNGYNFGTDADGDIVYFVSPLVDLLVMVY